MADIYRYTLRVTYATGKVVDYGFDWRDCNAVRMADEWISMRNSSRPVESFVLIPNNVPIDYNPVIYF